MQERESSVSSPPQEFHVWSVLKQMQSALSAAVSRERKIGREGGRERERRVSLGERENSGVKCHALGSKSVFIHAMHTHIMHNACAKCCKMHAKVL